MSNVAHREVLGVASLEVLEVELDFAQVFVEVARRHQFLFTGDELLLIVDANDNDGHTGLEGDVIEAFLPVGIGLAGSLGSDGKMKHFAAVAGLYHLVDQGVALTPIDGDATDGTKHGAKGPKEPLFLHHKLGLATNGGIEELAEEEVPIAGVRTAADDILGMVGDGDTGVPP